MTSSTSTGIVWCNEFLEHDTGSGHPERPDRLRVIYRRLSDMGFLRQDELIAPDPVDMALVERVHADEYVARFRKLCEQRRRTLDTPDCPICPATYEIARLAAGGAVAAVDAVMAGRVRNAFCPVRPPGHHAEYRAAMGFCFFNNIAIAAEHLQVNHGLGRVAILDWDVHHGNGTQHHFEADPNTLFISIHQHPYTLFPGTGFEWETGTGEAENTVLNLPVMPGADDGDYRRAFDESILPRIAEFKPEFLLVSAGFDPHRRDPLSQVNLTTEMFGWMTREVRRLAGEICQGRLVTVLEGGYDLEALADCVQAHVEMLDHGGPPTRPGWSGPEI